MDCDISCALFFSKQEKHIGSSAKQCGLKKKEWGPTKCITKEAILSTNEDFLRFSRFPNNIFHGVFFTKNGFIAPDMVPWLSKKSEDQSGGPKTNLEVFGDKVSFQYFQKT